jgi:hypothetical protein
MITLNDARQIKAIKHKIGVYEKELDDTIREAIMDGLDSARFACPNKVVADMLHLKYSVEWNCEVEYYERDRAYSPEQTWTLVVSLKDV